MGRHEQVKTVFKCTPNSLRIDIEPNSGSSSMKRSLSVDSHVYVFVCVYPTSSRFPMLVSSLPPPRTENKPDKSSRAMCLTSRTEALISLRSLLSFLSCSVPHLPLLFLTEQTPLVRHWPPQPQTHQAGVVPAVGCISCDTTTRNRPR